MSEQAPDEIPTGTPAGQDAPVERGGSEEASGVPLTETEVETSKKPEDRDGNV
ncbi:hypothetical protein [Geodermatophilus sp. SYSU D00815]